MSHPRRHFTAEFKLETVLEGLRGEKSIAQICRERRIKDTQYYKWREQFLTRVPSLFAPQADRQAAEQAERIAALERMVGRLTMENDILKKASSWLNSPRSRNGT